jgi:hypothetical protein
VNEKIRIVFFIIHIQYILLTYTSSPLRACSRFQFLTLVSLVPFLAKSSTQQKKKEKKKLQITRAPNCICQTNTRAAQKQKFSSPRQREYEHRESTSRAFVVGFFLALDDDEQRERRCTAAD